MQKKRRSATSRTRSAPHKPMPHILYLTADEQTLFRDLSGSLKEGWEVQAETQSFQDNDQRRRIRYELLKLEDPIVKDFLQNIATAKTEQEFQAVIEKTDFTKIANKDLMELLFAIGPDGVSVLVKTAIEQAQTDDDLMYAAELSNARHELLASLQNFSA
jgi:hypothetical protein